MNMDRAWKRTYEDALDAGMSDEAARDRADRMVDSYVDMKIEEAKERRLFKGRDE